MDSPPRYFLSAQSFRLEHDRLPGTKPIISRFRYYQDRRSMLESWGFQCACARCETEAEEEKHPEKNCTRRNQEGRKMLGKLKEMMELSAG